MPSLLQISWIFGHTSTWRKLCTKIPKMRNQKICKPRNLTFFEETYSQWNWFWPIFVFCNNSSISQPNLMLSSAFFRHWSVDSDTHLNFENSCRHSDFRDILRRQVNKKILYLPNFWWPKFFEIIVWTKKEDCYCRKHVNIYFCWLVFVKCL